MRKEYGLTLTELMIALFLSTLLISLLLQQYVTAKKHYLALQKQLNQNFELNLVSDLIKNSVRQAGFAPCRSVGQLETVDRRDKSVPLLAYIIDDHGLVLNRMSEHFATVQYQYSAQQILVEPGAYFALKQPVLIADCYHAEVQLLKTARSVKEGMLLTLQKPLAYSYIDPIYVGQWLEERFYIHKNPHSQLTLYYQNGHSEELSELINSLSVEAVYPSLLNITLGYGDDKKLPLTTRIRA
ncbi:PilW family protein [Legionella dresdenensis]|uniref:PilW family protein n=1 Tax=Legionella dresdenensis TaxID=450200 RepID=A0ABV8CCB7_9GAMM